MQPTGDTIAARASAAGSARRSILRLSGPEAIALAGGLLNNVDLATRPGFSATDTLLALPSAQGRPACELPCRVYLFHAPRSYTRQDVVELHLPGCDPLAEAVLGLLLDRGARRAGPGEFTLRAFLAGRIDLAEAQAVADLIAATDDATHRRAQGTLGGELHRRTEPRTAVLSEALATLEASIDLADEDIQLAAPKALAGQLIDIADSLEDLARRAERMTEGSTLPVVALSGRPNAGKSTLLNALAGWQRAMTSPEAGTTRDVLSAEIALPGGDAWLEDLAGLADPSDPLGEAAARAARAALARADVLVFLRPLDAPDAPADAALLDELRRANPRAPLLVLDSKADLPMSPAETSADLRVSAETGLGLEALRERLAELLELHTVRSGEPLGLHDRQRRCLQSAGDAARQAAALLAPAGCLADVAELAAVDLRDALRHLADITGEVVTEDILGHIFARFCVGK